MFPLLVQSILKAHKSIPDSHRLGKFDSRLLERLVYPRLGAKRTEVLVGPGFGLDNAIVRIGRNRVMVLTTDPITMIPALGPQDSAWLSASNIASDVTTSGFPPAYVIVDFNLPPQMRDDDFGLYWNELQRTFGELGAMIVGGHTGRFEGCDYTIIGGCTLIAIGEEGKYLSSRMANPGDSIMITKSAALSSAGILSRVFPHKIESIVGLKSLRRTRRLFRMISTVEDALTLASLGVREAGVSAMHDATEGGVFAAIYEMLTASSAGGVISRDLIPIWDEVFEICSVFSLDPYTSLSEGCLIAAVRSDRVEDAIRASKRKGIVCVEVGKVKDKAGGIRLRAGSREEPLKYPRSDPYWSAYWRAIKKGWK